jgi:hypothetical protein
MGSHARVAVKLTLLLLYGPAVPCNCAAYRLLPMHNYARLADNLTLLLSCLPAVHAAVQWSACCQCALTCLSRAR